MHINPFTKQSIKMIVTGAIALAAIGTAATAEARPNRSQVNLAGTGVYEMDEFSIFARGAGSVSGRPYAGTATFLLNPDDGTWPEPGECEQGNAGFAVTGTTRQYLWGVSIGEICGQHVQQPTNLVSHVYTGDYSLVESPQRVRDTEGWIEIRLATDNNMSITLFDS